MNALLAYFKELLIVKKIIFLMLFLLSYTSFAQQNIGEIPAYKPKDKALFKKIKSLDSIYFNAYNTCDMKTQASIYSEEIEFFHDLAGLSTSKSGVLKSIKKNICGKVTRILVEDSIEVYPIPGYGAIEIGYHAFYNKKEPDAKLVPSRFTIVWQKREESWKITKVISLHK